MQATAKQEGSNESRSRKKPEGIFPYIERGLTISLILLALPLLATTFEKSSAARWILFMVFVNALSARKRSRDAADKQPFSPQLMTGEQASAKGHEIAFMLSYTIAEETRLIVRKFATESHERRDYMRTYVELLMYCLYLVQRRIGGEFNQKARASFDSALLSTIYDLVSRQLSRNEPNAEFKFMTLYSLRVQQYDECQSQTTSRTSKALPRALHYNLCRALKFIAKEDRMLSLFDALGGQALAKAEEMVVKSD